MVVGSHIMWSAYGCWLPNDPRGSSSQGIRVEPLTALGELHHGRKHNQPRGREIRGFYKQADDILAHERRTFILSEVPLIGASLGKSIRSHGYTCYACAIMPDHVHLLMRRHRDWAEVMMEHFQEDSKRAIIEAGLRPVNHPVCGGPGWKVFKNTRQEMERTVVYIRKNPLEIGWPEQHWDFVTDYDGWLPRAWKITRLRFAPAPNAPDPFSGRET